MVNEYRVLINNLEAGTNGLLGEFNAENIYDIADNIKQELIKANKLISSYKPDNICATANIGSHSFSFIVYVQLGEQNKKRLSLFLEEKCNFFDEEKQFLTLLSSVVIEISQNILEVLKKEFSMYIADESTGIDMANSNLINIVQRKDKVLQRAKFLQGELIPLNKAYVLKMLSLIKSCEYKNQFLVQFKNIVNNKKIDKNDVKYWLKLKNILDKMMFENESLFTGKIKQQIEDLQNGYIHMVLNAKEPVMVKAEGKKSKKQDAKKKPKKKSDDEKKVKTSPKKESNTPLKQAKVITGDIFTPRPRTLAKDLPINKSLPNHKPMPESNKSENFSILMATIFDKGLNRGKRKEDEKAKKQKTTSDDGRSL